MLNSDLFNGEFICTSLLFSCGTRNLVTTFRIIVLENGLARTLWRPSVVIVSTYWPRSCNY